MTSDEEILQCAAAYHVPAYLLSGRFPMPPYLHHRWRRRVLCRIGLHRWSPPRADGYQRSVCERCGLPWRLS